MAAPWLGRIKPLPRRRGCDTLCLLGQPRWTPRTSTFSHCLGPRPPAIRSTCAGRLVHTRGAQRAQHNVVRRLGSATARKGAAGAPPTAPCERAPVRTLDRACKSRRLRFIVLGAKVPVPTATLETWQGVLSSLVRPGKGRAPVLFYFEAFMMMSCSAAFLLLSLLLRGPTCLCVPVPLIKSRPPALLWVLLRGFVVVPFFLLRSLAGFFGVVLITRIILLLQ